MGWFSKKPTPQQYLNSVIKVATNLYLNTLAGEYGVTAEFEFKRNDSRYRYLTFCCSAVIASVLTYDEKKKIDADALCNGCIQFLNFAADDFPEEHFADGQKSENLLAMTLQMLQQYLQEWSHWAELEKRGENGAIVDLICKMIHTAESEKQITTMDMKRLGELGLEIDCRMLTLKGAVEDLVKNKN